MIELDAIIVGDGPAGLSAAARLQLLGHRIALLATPSSRVQNQLETVPQLDVITHAFPGLILDNTTLIAAKRTGVSYWTGKAVPTQPVSVIDRGCTTKAGFDNALLGNVASLDVPIFHVRKSELKAEFDQLWHVHAAGSCWRSRFLIDATGRHSPFRSRQRITSWQQVVLTGKLALHPETPALWTESLPDGWLWAIRDRDDSWLVSLFAEPSIAKPGQKKAWRRSLEPSHLAKHFACSSTPTLFMREVTPAAADAVYRQGLLHVGDSALARCPLASQGLSAAISDGQCVAIAVHSLLAGSASESLVADYLETKHRQSRNRHARFLSSSYASTPFRTKYWLDRGGADVSLPPSPELADFDRPLNIAPQWRLLQRPVIIGNCILSRPCLCSDEDILCFIAGISVIELLESCFVTPIFTARDLLNRWVRFKSFGEDFAIRLLHVLCQTGVLKPHESGA